jgi:hypothetical protein
VTEPLGISMPQQRLGTTLTETSWAVRMGRTLENTQAILLGLPGSTNRVLHFVVPKRVPGQIHARARSTNRKPTRLPATNSRIAHLPAHFHPSLVPPRKPGMRIHNSSEFFPPITTRLPRYPRPDSPRRHATLKASRRSFPHVQPTTLSPRQPNAPPGPAAAIRPATGAPAGRRTPPGRQVHPVSGDIYNARVTHARGRKQEPRKLFKNRELQTWFFQIPYPNEPNRTQGEPRKNPNQTASTQANCTKRPHSPPQSPRPANSHHQTDPRPGRPRAPPARKPVRRQPPAGVRPRAQRPPLSFLDSD